MGNPISKMSLTDAIWNCIEIMKKIENSEKNNLMNNPAADLITLKKICKELQKELAFATPDAEKVARLAEDARYLADCIKHWASEK